MSSRAPFDLRGCNIAALDDSAEDLRLVHEHLLRIPGWGGVFHAVTSPDEFRRLLADQPVDLAFIDYRLGPVTGLEIVRSLREEGERRALIAVTGQGDEHVAAQFIQAGADDYLIKDELNPELLRRSMEVALNCRRLESENRVLAEQLEHARKLESITHLAAGLAHDFNNLLACIVGNIDIAASTNLGDRARNALGAADGACRRMSDLVQTLMSFSRRDAVHRTQLDMRSLIEEVKVILEHTLEPGVTLRCDLGDDAILVDGNGTMLQQVVMNLAVNAAESMPSGGVLGLRLFRGSRRPVAGDAGDVVIEVTDQGGGIPPMLRDRIFDPYFSTKARSAARGAGLGLAVVRQNVLAHGGRVGVASEEGRGSTFTVTLPAAQWAITHIPPQPEPEVLERGEETWLIVDDENLVRQVARALLEELGYKVMEATDGASALEWLEGKRPEIDGVLLDLSMPRMGGEECLRRIRDLWPELPVAIATGHEDPVLCARLRDLGAREIIGKPYHLDELSHALRRALDGTSGTLP